MESILIYFLQSGISLGIFYLIFWFFLRKETFFHLHRFYLLVAIVVSMLAPLLSINYEVEPQVSNLEYQTQDIVIKMHEPFMVFQNVDTVPMKITKLLIFIYLIGAGILLIRLIYQIIWFIRILRNSETIRIGDTKIVINESQFVPYSFFNVICINRNSYCNYDFERIITHEQIHIQQRHYLDVLLIELVTVFQWFNPVVWKYERSLKETHEYLADNGVLACGFDKAGYQSLLLNQVVGVQMFGLANNFNHSLTKKRIIMMTKIQSSQWAKLKIVVVLPVLCLVMFAFAKPEYKSLPKKAGTVQNKKTVKDSIYKNPEKNAEFVGGEKALMEFVGKNTRYPAKARDKKLQGKVMVSFVVDKDGAVKNPKIVKTSNEIFNSEVLRVVGLLPKFKPATDKGKAVASIFVVPFDFTLTE